MQQKIDSAAAVPKSVTTPGPTAGTISDKARSPGRATSTRLMHKEEKFRRQQRLSTGRLSITTHEVSGDVKGRGQHASDSGYGTDSPGYSGQFPGHYRDPRQAIAAEDRLTSDSESEDLHDALSVSSARDSEDDDVFVTDMMTVCFENARMTPHTEIENTDCSRTNEIMDELDELDGDPPSKDNSGGKQTSGSAPRLEEMGAVGGARTRALPLTISTAVDIPASPRHWSTNTNFTPPRFYSGNTTFPFPPSPTLFGSPPENVFAFGRRAPPPSNLQRSLHIDHSLTRQRSFSDKSNETDRPSGRLNVALRERVFSENDMTRTRTQSESAATSSRSEPLPSCFRDRSYSESAIQMRLQRRVGRELRRISDEFHVSYTSPSSSPVQNGMVRSEGLHTSRSYPGSSRGATLWQSILQQFSPFFGQRLETIESPVDAIDDPFFPNDVSDDGASSPVEKQSSTRRQSRVTFDFSLGEMDDLDDEDNDDIDDIDGIQ